MTLEVKVEQMLPRRDTSRHIEKANSKVKSEPVVQRGKKRRETEANRPTKVDSLQSVSYYYPRLERSSGGATGAKGVECRFLCQGGTVVEQRPTIGKPKDATQPPDERIENSLRNMKTGTKDRARGFNCLLGRMGKKTNGGHQCHVEKRSAFKGGSSYEGGRA